MNNQQSTKVVTGQVRLSYAHLFKPHSNNQGQEPKFSATILLPKSDISTKAAIDAAINTAFENGVANKWGGVRPPRIDSPLHDGDGVRPSGEPFGPECKGHWVFTASSKNAPEVVTYPSLERILNESEVYSGIYALVSVNFFPYNVNGKRGVGAGLNNVAKVADGGPLGGRTSAASDFGGAQPQQGYQAPPQQYQQPAPQDSAWPNQLGGQPQQTYQQPPQTYQAPPQQYQQAPQNYQQPAPQPQQGYQQQPQQAPQQIDPITGLPIGGVMGI